MRRTLAALALPILAVISVPAFAQYTAEPAGAPPAELPAAYSALLQKDGVKVSGGGKVVGEFWMASATPSGNTAKEEAVSLEQIKQGAFIGVVRFSGRGGNDRRGQTIKPGLYTLRYSLHPVSGDHQGVAPQRDFALLSPIAADPDPAALPGFAALVAMSQKASGAPHPAVMSIWKSGSAAAAPSISQEGDTDWVLSVKLGDVPLSMIVVGVSDH
jgi:hypothetical protein